MSILHGGGRASADSLQARAGACYAYRDDAKAAELDPDWDAPKKELARFTVRRP